MLVCLLRIVPTEMQLADRLILKPSGRALYESRKDAGAEVQTDRFLVCLLLLALLLRLALAILHLVQLLEAWTLQEDAPYEDQDAGAEVQTDRCLVRILLHEILLLLTLAIL